MKEKIKKLFTEAYGGIFLSLWFSFMLLFYEPINLYASNMKDFWFDIYAFFPFIIKQFFIVFLILSVFFIIIRRIHINIYKFFLIGFFILTVCLYIQGNYLIGSLPPMDGQWIDFNLYKTEKIISIIVWLTVTVGVLFSLYKFKFKKVEKVSMYISLAVIVMLSTSMISFITQEHFFDEKDGYYATMKNFNDISSDKNFFIFLIDAADSQEFTKGLERTGEINEIMKDFTYYPNTTSTYLFTMFSIPYIIGGEYYENDEYFLDYFTRQIDESKLLKRLEDEGYVLNLYEDSELANYNGTNIERFKNMQNTFIIDEQELFNQELKYIYFKYLPYQLKWRAKVDQFSLSKTKKINDSQSFYEDNLLSYNMIKDNDLNVIKDKNFQFVHIEGAHPPNRYDKDLNVIEDGTYEQNIDASVTILKTYLNRIRNSEYYDNSIIMIMADHGFGDEEIVRSNPILYIKGFNEKHDYQVSNTKVSFENYQDAYQQLIDGDTTDKLFKNLDNSKRRIMYCLLFHCDHIEEMYQTGDSWNTKTIIKTGNEYNR